MPQIGNNAKPGHSYHAYGGTTYPNQEAEQLALPADQRIRITRLGVWAAGWNQSCKARLCLWHLDGTLLGQSAEITFANGGAAGEGTVSLYTADLETPYETAAPGETVYVGFARDRDDAHQVNTGALATDHYHGKGTYGVAGSGPFAGLESYATQSRRIGAWVEDYEPLANAWVLRSGIWQRTTPSVRRGAADTEAESVQVFRTGVWVDAD